MKGLFVSVAALAVVMMVGGCATTAPKQPFKDDQGNTLMVSGSQAFAQITIYVNGETVIENATVNREMVSTYEGKKVRALCEQHTGLISSDFECDVYIGGEYAANLYFR